MTEKTFEGKTHAEWIALRGNRGPYIAISQAKVEEAILWFEEQNKKSSQDIEERRFQTQLDESRRQAWWTRLIAVIAVAISAGSLVVAILAFLRPSPSQSQTAQILQPASIVSPQTTSAVPATATKP